MIINAENEGAWLGQSEEHATFDLDVLSSSPMFGVKIKQTKNFLKKMLRMKIN